MKILVVITQIEGSLALLDSSVTKAYNCFDNNNLVMEVDFPELYDKL